MKLNNIVDKVYENSNVQPLSDDFKDYGVSADYFSFSTKEYISAFKNELKERIMSIDIINDIFSSSEEIPNDNNIEAFIFKRINSDKNINNVNIARSTFNTLYVDTLKHKMNDLVLTDFFISKNSDPTSEYISNLQLEKKNKLEKLVTLMAGIQDRYPAIHKSILNEFKTYSDRPTELSQIPNIDNLSETQVKSLKQQLKENKKTKDVVELFIETSKKPEFSPDYIKAGISLVKPEYDNTNSFKFVSP